MSDIKKKGRPKKKIQIDNIDNIINDNATEKKVEKYNREIMVRLCLTVSDLEKYSKNPEAMDKEDETIDTINNTQIANNHNDYDIDNDYDENILSDEYKHFDYLNCDTSDDEEEEHIPINIEFEYFDIKKNEKVVPCKTDKLCWWCSHKFDTNICFLPEYVEDGVYHVYGIFCSINCSLAYNHQLNDFKSSSRVSMLKSLFNIGNKFISRSPPKETLQAFGGPLTIEEYRSKLYTYDILMSHSETSNKVTISPNICSFYLRV